MFSFNACICMIRLLVVLATTVILSIQSVHAGEQLPDNFESALSMLDEALDNRKQYIDRRLQRIDSLMAGVAKSDEYGKLALYKEIGDEYLRFNVDSAISYYYKGEKKSIALGDKKAELIFKMNTSATVPLVGIMREEVDFYDSIDHVELPKEVLPVYYQCGTRLFFYISRFYKQFPSLQYSYLAKGLDYNDKVVSLAEPGSPEALLYTAQAYYLRGENTLAVATLNDLMELVPMDDNYFARAANMLAIVYSNRGRKRESMYYLALSAISDVKAATLEETSLMELGIALYEDGDIDRAYRYLIVSLNNAVASGAKMRALESSLALPYISQNYNEKEMRHKTWMYIFIGVLVVALGAIAVAVLMVRRDVVKLRDLKQRLSEDNKIKEAYNGQFLNLSSIYMDKLEEFNKLVGRKIAAKQVDDLYSFVKSGRIMEEQSRMFYEMFDKAFVHTYPTFVKEVNALLLPDKRVELPDGALLNTELRILAFMRLGLEDGNRIAKFLNLSLNTIYTYRNKLKGRAIHRDTFESDVMSIGRID